MNIKEKIEYIVLESMDCSTPDFSTRETVDKIFKAFIDELPQPETYEETAYRNLIEANYRE